MPAQVTEVRLSHEPDRLVFTFDDGYAIAFHCSLEERHGYQLNELRVRRRIAGGKEGDRLVATSDWRPGGFRLFIPDPNLYSRSLLEEHLRAAKAAAHPIKSLELRRVAVGFFACNQSLLDQALRQFAQA